MANFTMGYPCMKVNVISTAMGMISALFLFVVGDSSVVGGPAIPPAAAGAADAAKWIGAGSILTAAGSLITAALKMMYDDRKERRTQEGAAREHDEKMIRVINDLGESQAEIVELKKVTANAHELEVTARVAVVRHEESLARIAHLEAMVARASGEADRYRNRLDAVEVGARKASGEADHYRNRLDAVEVGARANRAGVDEAKTGVAEIKKAMVDQPLNTVHIPITPVVAIMIDSAGTIISVSGDIVFLLHYSNEELLGHNVKMVIPDAYHAAHGAGLARSSDSRVPFPDRVFRGLKARTKQGEEVPVDLRLTRWVESGDGDGATADGVRFGALIREHRPGGTDLTDPLPPFERGGSAALVRELAQNNALTAENSRIIAGTNPQEQAAPETAR